MSWCDQVAVLMLALVMLALSPLFYLYIALSPPWFHSDTLACGAEGFSDKMVSLRSK